MPWFRCSLTEHSRILLCWAQVRTLVNDIGKPIEHAGPSIAAQIVGLSSVPQAGDEFTIYSNDADGRTAAEQHSEGMRNQRINEMTGGGSMVTLSSLASIDEDAEVIQKLNLVIKVLVAPGRVLLYYCFVFSQ